MRASTYILLIFLSSTSLFVAHGQWDSQAKGTDNPSLRTALAQDDGCYFVISETREIHLHGSESAVYTSPQYPIPKGLRAISISSGYRHALALTAQGEVVAWGSNEFGECDVPDGLTAIQVWAGEYYSLALDIHGKVWAWGSNEMNRCSVPRGLKAKKISAGPNHALAINKAGYVVGWGGWDKESLETTRSLTEALTALAPPKTARQLVSSSIGDAKKLGWLQVLDIPESLRAKFVVAGPDFSAAVKHDGKIVGWGYGNPFNDFPQDLPSPVKSIHTGNTMGSMVCVLLEDGTVLANALGSSSWTEWTFQVTDLSVHRRTAIAIDSDGQLRVVGCDNWSTVAPWDKDPCDIPQGLKPLIIGSSTPLPPPSLTINTESIATRIPGPLEGRSENALEFDITNNGPGIATDLEINLTIEDFTSDIVFYPSNTIINFIEPGSTEHVSFPVTCGPNAISGVLKVTIDVEEPRGFSPPPIIVELPVAEFLEPAVEVSDFASSLSSWKPNTAVELDVLVQNIGRGDASDVVANLSLPDGVLCFSGNQSQDIGTLTKGEVYKLTYDLMIPRTYVGSDVTIGIQLSESYNEYGAQWSHSFPFEGSSEETVVIIQKEPQDRSQEPGVVRAKLGKAADDVGEIIFSRTNSSRDIQAIAVIPKDGENCSGRTIRGDDLAVFGETAMLGLYTVVDRKFFEQTLEEIKLSMTGLTFENGVLEAGCIENAQGYLFVEHGCLQNQETIKAKLIHCESSEIIWNGLGQGTTAKETFEEIVARLNQE